MASRFRFSLNRVLGFAFLLAALAVAGYTLYLDVRVREEFEGRRFALPARIFARPLELHAGLNVPQAAVEQELRDLGYRDVRRESEAGWFERRAEGLEISLRPFVFWDGAQPQMRVRVEFKDGRITGLRDAAGAEVPLARVEPQLIGGIYPANNEDRLLIRLAEVPPHFLHALVATEDHRFYSHHGFDLRGIARAAISSVSGRGVQGGSTLTQQLVKNFFLTPERSLQRKFTELIMAVLLELHYDKNEILETYLNEIYLGQDRDRAIHGVGLAAQYYFGKQIGQLTVPESALLVGMVKGPTAYDPHRHPQRALERRNLVLRETRELGSITMEQYTEARAAKLGVTAKPSTGTSPYPAFVQLVHRQLRRDYDEKDLRSEGLRIFTTLDPRAQVAAERALTRRLAQLEKEKRAEPGLEGAVVVTDPQSGEVQALVGGRDARFRGFNRAVDAARQVGSLLKPAIYLTALSDPSLYTLVTPLDDGPFVWKSRGAKDWKPQNYDRKFHGMVPLRTALAQSYNTSAARLGTDLGVEKVLDTVKRMGVDRPVQPFASSLLGAVDLSPLEVAQMYQTVASGGFRTPMRAIREVTTQDGTPIKRYPLAVEQAFPAEPMHLLTFAMQDVVREGTGQVLKNWLPPEIGAAGKTGTTDEQRDAWFAGFTGDRLAVVWFGYDDNRAARLSGGATAAPVWGELMAALSPEPLVLPLPEAIELVPIDPQTGLRGGSGCAGTREVPFVKGSAPAGRAPCAGEFGVVEEAVKETVEAVKQAVEPVKNWLQRLFGK